MGQVCSVLAACYNFVCCCYDNTSSVPVAQSIEEPRTSRGVGMIQPSQVATGRRWDEDEPWMEEEDMVFNEGRNQSGQGSSDSPSASSGRHVNLPLPASTGNEGLASAGDVCIVKYRIPLIQGDVVTYATHGLTDFEKMERSRGSSPSIPSVTVPSEMVEEAMIPMRGDQKNGTDMEQLQ